MAPRAPRDFSSMLDELLSERSDEPDRAHLISIDYLSVVEELHSGRIAFSDDALDAAYASMGEPEQARPEPSLDPEEIARELGLAGGGKPKELDRLRREFALRNHPDRVPEHLRARAVVRMQVANMLIDEAKRRRVRRRKA
ncbi:hypothetical protein [Chelativorans sp. AA-79]|uniref:hypothetical protein n=1 Tax=Chelativorans sp. AA-79 TaxID=3028735 RepID=UPI0023F7C488|nr:hypothetical protein [Chelativorans sp. AA-79]WEX11669.1 hypothetical protein PVE73_12455 [Chelativorans sp. AA-79]